MHSDYFLALSIFHVDRCMTWCQVKKMNSSSLSISAWLTSHYFFEHMWSWFSDSLSETTILSDIFSSITWWHYWCDEDISVYWCDEDISVYWRD